MKNKMTPIEKNNFVVRHASKKHFKEDQSLYKRIFPDATLNKEIEVCPDFAKRKLNERMLLEMLSVVCGETILESRGVIKDHKSKKLTKFDKTKTDTKSNESDNDKFTIEQAEELLLKSDVDKLDYHSQMRAMVDSFNLELPDKKKSTFTKALADHKAQLQKKREGQG